MSYTSDINWHKCHLDWQAFVDRLRWADFFFDCNNHDELGHFSIKSNKQAPVSKDIALETFLATIENKLSILKEPEQDQLVIYLKSKEQI